MFLGEFTHNLDEKGRVVMPSAFRPALREEGLVVAMGKDGNVAVFPSATFDELAQVEMQTIRDRKARRRSRAMFIRADTQKLDAQGRVLIKEKLRLLAGLELATEVAVVGMYDHIEVWDLDTLGAEQEQADLEYRADEEVPGF